MKIDPRAGHLGVTGDLVKDDSGRPYPLGATVCPDGTNFSIFSASACGMQLVLFDHSDDGVAARTVNLDPVRHRTSHYWHIFLPGIKQGQLYGYRADGPRDPAAGQRFDPQKVLIDPYGKGVSVGVSYSLTNVGLDHLAIDFHGAEQTPKEVIERVARTLSAVRRQVGRQPTRWMNNWSTADPS